MTKQKTLKQLIKEFNTDKPDFTNLIPYLTGELEVNLEDFRGNLIGKYNAIKTLWQLSRPEKPQSRSRVWTSPNGYIYLVSWSNASLLRVLGVKLIRYIKEVRGSYRNLNSSSLPLISYKLLDRLEAQFLDALRSTIANQEEGFSRATTSEYLQFLGYSQGSLKEAKGDMQRTVQDGLIKSVPNSSLSGIDVDLKAWHEALKETVISKPHPSKSYKGIYRTLKEFTFGYLPVDDLNPATLTYEIFIELINKTEWHLRKLVESLEKKLHDERKFYQVEQERIKDKFRKR